MIRLRRRVHAVMVTPTHEVTHCDKAGHAYVVQPTPRVLRCVHCGDKVLSTQGTAR